MPNGRYAELAYKLRPGAAQPGEIVHLDGTLLGRHEGIINYTVGQRKGLGIGGRRMRMAIPIPSHSMSLARSGGPQGRCRSASGIGPRDRLCGAVELARR